MWRDGNQWSTSPIDEGFELFDCDREQIQNGEVGVEPEFNDESDNNKDKNAANTTGDTEKTQQTVTKTMQDPVILADLCEKKLWSKRWCHVSW